MRRLPSSSFVSAAIARATSSLPIVYTGASDPVALGFAASLARLMTLGDAMRVLPGHGPATSIGRERVANPFLNGQARVPGA